MADPLLQLAKVSSGYGETVVLEDVDLDLSEGQCVSIIGRNGVGKSTLMATIMGHANLRGGTIKFSGEDLTRMAAYKRCRAGICYVPQEREVFPSLTVQENIDVAKQPGEWTEDKVFDLFPNLADRRDNRGDQLSGGEQQMLAIARGLVGNPKLLLMDEPSEGLAPVIVEQLGEVITRLRDESHLAILLVEQHVKFALAFAETTIVMDRGQVVYTGRSKELQDEATLQKYIGVAA